METSGGRSAGMASGGVWARAPPPSAGHDGCISHIPDPTAGHPARSPRRTGESFPTPVHRMRLPARVRRITDPIAERIPVPIASGVNRGKLWSIVSAGSGYATGRRASAEMRLLSRLLRPGDVVWDVGAHHGFMTLLAAARVGPAGRVHAFEPSGQTRAILARHIRWNRLANVAVHPFALSTRDGQAHFGGRGTSKTYALGAGDEVVEVRAGRTLIALGTCAPPTFVKMDVEGAEADAVAGVIDALGGRARMLIAVHAAVAYERLRQVLHAAGYAMLASPELRANQSRTWVADPLLYCSGPAWEGGAADRQYLAAAGFEGVQPAAADAAGLVAAGAPSADR